MNQQLPTPEEKSLVRDTLELGSQRQALRQRRAGSEAMFRKSRRGDAKQKRAKQLAEQTLLTWANVYLNGKGNDAVRRNVTEAVHRQAELYSKQHGEPFTTSLKRLEEAMLGALVRSI